MASEKPPVGGLQQQASGWLVLPVVVIGGAVLYWFELRPGLGDDQLALAPKVAAASPTPALSDPTPEAAPRPCKLRMPGGSASNVVLFPTKDGLSAFIAAAVRGDDVETEAAFEEHHGFSVAAGTPCTRIDVGLMRTQVRVLEGPHAGAKGFVPTECTQ